MAELSYFVYGKYFTKNGASDYCLLDHSAEYNERNISPFLELVRPFKPQLEGLETKSVALLPFDDAYVLVQSQLHREDEIAQKMGMQARTNRQFRRTVFILLSSIEIERYVKEGKIQYRDIIELTEDPSELKNGEHSLRNYSKPGQVTPILRPSTYTSERSLTLPVTERIRKTLWMIEHTGIREANSFVPYSLKLYCGSNQSLDWASKLDMMEQLQLLLYNKHGILSFATENIFNQPVNLQFTDISVPKERDGSLPPFSVDLESVDMTSPSSPSHFERDYTIAKDLARAISTQDFSVIDLLLSRIYDMENMNISELKYFYTQAQSFVGNIKPNYVTRYGNVSAPRKVYKWQEFGIKVALGTQPLLSASPPLYLSAGTLTHKTSVDVVLEFETEEFESSDDLVKEISVEDLSSSAPVLFKVRALQEGRRSIRMQFFQNGVYKGGTTIEIETLARTTESKDDFASDFNVDDITNDFLMRIFDLTSIHSPDLTIYVGKKNGKYEFRLCSNKLGLKIKTVVGYVDISGIDPQKYMEDIYRELNQGITYSTNKELLDLKIDSIGTKLYDDLFPEDLKRMWWATIKDHVQSILIISDETWIPWEIIKPFSEAADGTLVEGNFLCEDFHLARWLQGSNSLPSQIDFRNLTLVISSEMKELEGDTEDLDLSQLQDLTLHGCSASVAAVLSLLASGGFDALHLAGHGVYRMDNPDYSKIALDDGDLQPVHISGARATFGKDHPIIFLNACASGRTSPSLTGVGGWVPQFLGAGASAFVGSTWNIDNLSASPFARCFYENLLGGMTIGAALHDARIKIKKAGDPSWLSYTMYANPDSIVLTQDKLKQLKGADGVTQKLLPFKGA